MIHLVTVLPTVLKYLTPKNLGIAAAGVSLLYGVHLIRANAAKKALIEQYKEAEKNWLTQWDNLVTAKALSEELAAKKLERSSALEAKSVETNKSIGELCDKHKGYCDTAIPDDIVKWMREHTY